METGNVGLSPNKINIVIIDYFPGKQRAKLQHMKWPYSKHFGLRDPVNTV